MYLIVFRTICWRKGQSMQSCCTLGDAVLERFPNQNLMNSRIVSKFMKRLSRCWHLK